MSRPVSTLILFEGREFHEYKTSTLLLGLLSYLYMFILYYSPSVFISSYIPVAHPHPSHHRLLGTPPLSTRLWTYLAPSFRTSINRFLGKLTLNAPRGRRRKISKGQRTVSHGPFLNQPGLVPFGLDLSSVSMSTSRL